MPASVMFAVVPVVVVPVVVVPVVVPLEAFCRGCPLHRCLGQGWCTLFQAGRPSATVSAVVVAARVYMVAVVVAVPWVVQCCRRRVRKRPWEGGSPGLLTRQGTQLSLRCPLPHLQVEPSLPCCMVPGQALMWVLR